MKRKHTVASRASLPRRARRILGRLLAKDERPLFALYGSALAADRVAARNPKSWARFVALGIADVSKLARRHCVLTELGMECIHLLRVYTTRSAGQLMWQRSRVVGGATRWYGPTRPVFVEA